MRDLGLGLRLDEVMIKEDVRTRADRRSSQVNTPRRGVVLRVLGLRVRRLCECARPHEQSASLPREFARRA